MKKIKLYTLFVLLLIASGLKTKAQEFLPILQEGNEWHTLVATEDGPYNYNYQTVIDRLYGDTIINNVQYKIVKETFYNTGNPYTRKLLREEDGKVWKSDNGITEILLYDFTANVGDTLRYGDFANEEYLILDSISIEQIGGVNRKKFWLGLESNWMGEYAIETWIEGIGSDQGLLYSGWYIVCGGYYRALCYHQNEELIWQNPEYDACSIDAVEEVNKTEMTIYPNPTSDMVVIEGIKAEEIDIYNINGQLVNNVQGTNEVSVVGLPEGIYLLRVKAINKEVYNAQFVVRR